MLDTVQKSSTCSTHRPKYLRVELCWNSPQRSEIFHHGRGGKSLFLEEFNAELNSKLPVINDVIITLLSSQTFEAVYTQKGKSFAQANYGYD